MNPELFERALHVCRLLTMVKGLEDDSGDSLDWDTLEEAIEAAIEVTTAAAEEG